MITAVQGAMIQPVFRNKRYGKTLRLGYHKDITRWILEWVHNLSASMSLLA